MADQPRDDAQVEMVRVVNKRAQTLTVTADSGSGIREFTVAGQAASPPLDKKTLTLYTLNLVNKGHFQLRPV